MRPRPCRLYSPPAMCHSDNIGVNGTNRRMMKRVFKIFGVLFLLGGLCLAGVGGYFWYLWSSNLPYVGSAREYRPPEVSTIFSQDGQMIGRFWKERRIVISLDQMPDHLIKAFVAAEDSRFFEHSGLDLKGILRALWKNLQAGRIEQGGSTITQQVTRGLLLQTMERTFRRKVREAILAIQLERAFSKEHILYLYLNQIYLGAGAYGVEAASQTYFGKPAKDLNLAEAALLAGLPQAPSRFSPVHHLDRARLRQHYVLERMLRGGFATKQEVDEALATPLVIKSDQEDTFKKAPYFSEYVRQYILEKYGQGLLYQGGLRIETTLDLSMQEAARRALERGLAELDKREGYRGPLRRLGPEEMESYKAVRIAQGAPVPLEAEETVEALVEVVDDQKGEVRVWLPGAQGKLPLSRMKWARKPDPDVPYYSGGIRRPSQALEPGDIILVKLLKPLSQKQVAQDAPKGRTALPCWEVALEQTPLVQGAVLCLDAETGAVKAMVGGRDFETSQFNRATQARRQPGSAFKPIIYAAALDRGMTPAEVILDAPYVSSQDPDEEPWKPKNYKETFYGPTLLRTALAKSRNVVTVKILKRIGVDYVIQYAKRLGIHSELTPDL